MAFKETEWLQRFGHSVRLIMMIEEHTNKYRYNDLVKNVPLEFLSRKYSPLVTVIVLNYNGRIFLERCFDSLKKQSYPNIELIMVDNASTDGSANYVETNFPMVKVIRNEKNLGYAEANNRAAKIAKGTYLFFLNNDTWLESNTIEELVRVIEKDESIGGCAPLIVDYEGKREISLGVGCDIFGYPLPTITKNFFYVDGAALFIRKQSFDDIGGFDGRYFIFYEDVDLSWRLWLYGYDIAVAPRAVVHHMSGGTVIGGAIKCKAYVTSTWRRYLGERNNICNLLKNYSTRTLLVVLPIYFLINIGEVVLFLAIGNVKAASSYVKSWCWNIRNIRDTLEWRKKIQRKRRISDKEIMKRMHKGCAKLLVLMHIGLPRVKE